MNETCSCQRSIDLIASRQRGRAISLCTIAQNVEYLHKPSGGLLLEQRVRYKLELVILLTLGETYPFIAIVLQFIHSLHNLYVQVIHIITSLTGTGYLVKETGCNSERLS